MKVRLSDSKEDQLLSRHALLRAELSALLRELRVVPPSLSTILKARARNMSPSNSIEWNTSISIDERYSYMLGIAKAASPRKQILEVFPL